MLAWMYQHTLGHHPYTNIDGADPDIETASEVSEIHSMYPTNHDAIFVMMSFVGCAGYSTNQMATAMVATVLLSAHLHAYALLCGKCVCS